MSRHKPWWLKKTKITKGGNYVFHKAERENNEKAADWPYKSSTARERTGVSSIYTNYVK
jgi:hypothetical protein